MSESSSQMTGACMCGKVTFEVTAPLVGSAYCHCKRCQRRTGTAFSTTGLTQPGSFRFTRGEELVRSYDPGDGGWIKSFCSECGSQLRTINSENPDVIAIRMGALDEDPGIGPGSHQFVTYAAPWYEIPDDGLPRFPERLTWDGDKPALEES